MISIELADSKDSYDIQMVFYKTWLSTYPNDEYKITVDDIEDRFKDRITPEGISKMAEKIINPDSNTLFVVAKDNGKVVGVCKLKIDENINQLKAIYVLPEYQGQGIGYMFWNRALEFFDENKDIKVEVASYNTNAINFYKKLGFIATDKKFINEYINFKSGAVLPETEMIIKRKK
jgi:ribosomal protein S18 acetylase RimI-like enzyme